MRHKNLETIAMLCFFSPFEIHHLQAQWSDLDIFLSCTLFCCLATAGVVSRPWVMLVLCQAFCVCMFLHFGLHIYTDTHLKNQ